MNYIPPGNLQWWSRQICQYSRPQLNIVLSLVSILSKMFCLGPEDMRTSTLTPQSLFIKLVSWGRDNPHTVQRIRKLMNSLINRCCHWDRTTRPSSSWSTLALKLESYPKIILIEQKEILFIIFCNVDDGCGCYLSLLQKLESWFWPPALSGSEWFLTDDRLTRLLSEIIFCLIFSKNFGGEKNSFSSDFCSFLHILHDWGASSRWYLLPMPLCWKSNRDPYSPPNLFQCSWKTFV